MPGQGTVGRGFTGGDSRGEGAPTLGPLDARRHHQIMQVRRLGLEGLHHDVMPLVQLQRLFCML